MGKKILLLLFIVITVVACNRQSTETEKLLENAYIDHLSIDGTTCTEGKTLYNVSTDYATVIKITFSKPIETSLLDSTKLYFSNTLNYHIIDSGDSNTLVIQIDDSLKHEKNYHLYLNKGQNFGINLIDDYVYSFKTVIDSTYKFPVISDDSLLTLVQQKTFSYFWYYGHPVSGLARERYGSGETVTMGGSGFGIMAIPVAIERGFITRQEGLERMQTIVDFLENKANRFHGAFPHWMNGTTGAVIPFSTKDDGGDLVETAFLMEGLLTVGQYFSTGNTAERLLSAQIDSLYADVEWDWYTQNKNALYWHWSPNYGFDINMQISGWNEALIVYVLAASSPTHPITKEIYENGWADNGNIMNGNSYYDITLPLGQGYGGPMFFEHYSFLGLDPRNLSDQYANYWLQATAHAQINEAYCAANPKKYEGYSKQCWGLTACDIQNGYSACSPTNDLGTIAPTAAIASMPYTPEKSMKALKFFYYILGDKTWGEYGFYDSFDLSTSWYASSYLAIDQGPIVDMIENYRTGLLWNLFMQRSDIQSGLTKLGFSY